MTIYTFLSPKRKGEIRALLANGRLVPFALTGPRRIAEMKATRGRSR